MSPAASARLVKVTSRIKDPDFDRHMRLQAQAEAEYAANPDTQRSNQHSGEINAAALYEPLWWINGPEEDWPTRATYLGVDGWRLVGGTMLAGSIGSGQFVQWGKAKLIMQNDGNLVLYDENRQPRWDSGTWNSPGAFMVFQEDGNLVIYNRDGFAIKQSATFGSGFNLHVQEDGNVVIYAPVWRWVWQTFTNH